MTHPPITRLDFLGYLRCPALYVMIALMVTEALFSALTTWLIIKTGRDIVHGEFVAENLIWILATQSGVYIASAASWYFAERAGFHAFGQYMLRFAGENHAQTRLLSDRQARKRIEPFLTGTTFRSVFGFVREIEDQLRLFLGLLFNAAVLGLEIDAGLPAAYAATFVILMVIQWAVRRRLANICLDRQHQNSRVAACGYGAWDNVLTGNQYNWRLWLDEFKRTVRDCSRAQVRATMARQSLSALGGIAGLAIVFSTVTFVAFNNLGDIALLVGLATTLPRQIVMINAVHELTAGWNDVLALWTRLGSVVNSMRPQPDPNVDKRIKFDRLVLREEDRASVCSSVEEAVRLVLARPRGRVLVRGGNGTGKSTLLAALKAEIKDRAYYWPSTDRLAFRCVPTAGPDDPGALNDDEDEPRPRPPKHAGISAGERQLKSLEEIVQHTDAQVYLLDEWDAHLDPADRAMADSLVDVLAQRARVVEIARRDGP